jgi:hypothetical protein
MPLYAHARIEDPEQPGKFYERGDTVPEKLAKGLDSVSKEKYDPASDEVPAPDVVEIDGVRYTKEAPDA